MYSPAFRWGLIEAGGRVCESSVDFPYSPAFRWGLIEALYHTSSWIPLPLYSPAFRWGLIEARGADRHGPRAVLYSPAFRWGLIEANEIIYHVLTFPPSIPRHFAGASLKPPRGAKSRCRSRRIPRHFAGASLKQSLWRLECRDRKKYSPAFRWGLIEARLPRRRARPNQGIPRHFAGASLKQETPGVPLPDRLCIPRHFAGASLKPRFFAAAATIDSRYSPAFRWGLIEATGPLHSERRMHVYSPAFRWGLIEAHAFLCIRNTIPVRIPRHFAGASLKPWELHSRLSAGCSGIPRHFAGASLKLGGWFFLRMYPLGGIPRHFAGASLKRESNEQGRLPDAEYSPAFRWGLIEAAECHQRHARTIPYSPAFRWGLIEARITVSFPYLFPICIPRHFAGASLKRRPVPGAQRCEPVFPGISLGPH